MVRLGPRTCPRHAETVGGNFIFRRHFTGRRLLNEKIAIKFNVAELVTASVARLVTRTQSVERSYGLLEGAHKENRPTHRVEEHKDTERRHQSNDVSDAPAGQQSNERSSLGQIGKCEQTEAQPLLKNEQSEVLISLACLCSKTHGFVPSSFTDRFGLRRCICLRSCGNEGDDRSPARVVMPPVQEFVSVAVCELQIVSTGEQMG